VWRHLRQDNWTIRDKPRLIALLIGNAINYGTLL
jgi:hypothetical protein